MSVYFLLHHGHHVKCVAHGVETEDPGKFLETGPEIHSDQQMNILVCSSSKFLSNNR